MSESDDVFALSVEMAGEWRALVGRSPPPHADVPPKLHAVFEAALMAARPNRSKDASLPRITQIWYDGAAGFNRSSPLLADPVRSKFLTSGLRALLRVYAPPESLRVPIDDLVAAFAEALPAPSLVTIVSRQASDGSNRGGRVQYDYVGGSEFAGTCKEGRHFEGDQPPDEGA